MRPKGKLFALLAVFAAIGLITASGAFTTVQAERTVTVSTAGDSSALLGLEGNSSSAGNGEFVNKQNQQIVIDLSTNVGSNGASGVNLNATTTIDHMINVSNRGTQNITFYVTTTDSSPNVDIEFYNGSGANITTSSNSFTIESGKNASVGMKIVTDNATPESFDETVTFHANSTS